ncbi:type II secretion system F family protein [Muribacter muris]|uniref:Type II secretion system F family protein n=1 Tax=Muribacter muris TaxID=67855 RepID=A0A4Y9K820_9PAST|nr:type II secretion system F family protein [Muribacter muris]MBF0783923.1 type II secretion system F family protein [Muribacter muris]MBF0826421.1 type II secretion system F family protein [Muribacter muris]TFV13319.1 type II secretion system F family protein [Muribacter muris]
MPKIYQFHWRAVNRFQQKQTGKTLAESREMLEKRLLSQGFQRVRISRNFVFAHTPKAAEITQTAQQLALLLNAAVPLKQSLNILLENSLNIKIHQWLTQLITTIESGFSFSAALEKQALYLSPQEIQLIKIGEQSGKLTTILTNLAHSRAKSDKLAQKVKKILFYPAFILAISLILSILLLLFIVPQFAELYGEKNRSLPLITEFLFNLSQILQIQFLTLLIIIGILLCIFYLLAKKTTIIRSLKFKLLSHLPIFNHIITYSRIIFFCQNSALMLNSSIRLDTIIHSFIADKHSDPILQQNLAYCLLQLKQGYRLAESLNPAMFNNEVIQMIAIGEKSGHLSQMLAHISENYQQKLDYQIDILSQLLEPILMIIMGIIVGTIIIGLYLPIFDMGAMIE